MGLMTRALLLALVLTALFPLAVSAQDAAPDTALPAPDAAFPLLVSARSDLELLAENTLAGARPTGWSGSLDTNDPQLPVLIRLDLELLAGELLGSTRRPDGWFGAVGITPFSVARDIRHDLELLADTVVEPHVRPPGWIGSDPLMRCSRAAQSLTRLLERDGYIVQAQAGSVDFCAALELELTRHVEQVLLAPRVAVAPPAPSAPAALGLTGMIREGLRGAAVFSDRNARQRAGVLPEGVTFTAIARSTAQFSNMMLVQGEGFQVFVDYTFTSIDLPAFETLPALDTVAVGVTCVAAWCEG